MSCWDVVFEERTDFMKTRLIAAIIALTSTIAAADQATYDKYIEESNQASFCIGFGDILQNYHLDEMVEVLSEDRTMKVMDVRNSALNRWVSLFIEVPLESSMNKIWKQRFQNNAKDSRQVDGQRHGRNMYKFVGLRPTVILFFDQCKKQTWLDVLTP